MASWNVFGLREAQFETFLLVLIRVSAMLATAPIFSQKQIPRELRFGLGLLLALVVAQAVPTIAPLGLDALLVGALCQLFVGLVFGFVAYLLFAGIQFAGEIIDTEVGFAMVNIINPLTSQSVTLIGEFQVALATLLYITLDAHHALIAGIGSSFRLLPLPYVAAPTLLYGDVMRFFTQALFIVFEIAGPIVVAVFLAHVMLGLMTRVAPQINVFVVGLPLQVAIGLIMLIVTMPLFGAVFPTLVQQSQDQIDTLLRVMAGTSSPAPSPTP
jgi:flagellar biosynthetic protein FliR